MKCKSTAFPHMPLCVSLKLYSVVFHLIQHIFHSLFPPPAAAADWLSSLPLVVLQQCDSVGGVADVGPGKEGAAVGPGDSAAGHVVEDIYFAESIIPHLHIGQLTIEF